MTTLPTRVAATLTLSLLAGASAFAQDDQANTAATGHTQDQMQTHGGAIQIQPQIGAAAIQAGELSPRDVAFVQSGILSNLAEIASAQMAIERAGNEQVRAFAQQMLVDHPLEQQALLDIAAAAGIEAPTQLDPVHQERARQMSAVTGAEFDRLYMTSQVTDHMAAVDLHSREATEGSNPVVVGLAQQFLPVVQMHLQMAQQIGTEVGATVAAQ